MPEMRSYVVTQVREVHVSANSAQQAVLMGRTAFEGNPAPAGIWGSIDNPVRENSLRAEEKR